MEKLTPFVEMLRLIGRYICGYEVPTNLQNFTQKDLIEVKIFQKVLGSTLFEHPVH